MQIREVVTEFHFDCQVRKLSSKTIALYDRQLEYLAAYMENTTGITNIEEVRSIHIKKFLVGKTEAGRKPQYINDLLKAFKVFFKYCVQEGHIQTDPCAKVQNVKQPKVKIRTFNEDEIRKMLNYYSGRKFTDIRNKTMLAMFFDTGMRLNEVLTLKQEQIHDEYILVHGKGNKERLVPVSPFLAKLLLKYRVVRDSYKNLYQGVLTENSLYSPGIQLADYAAGVMNGYLRGKTVSQGTYQFATDLYEEFIFPRLRSHANGTIVGYGVIDIPKKTPFRGQLEAVFHS